MCAHISSLWKRVVCMSSLTFNSLRYSIELFGCYPILKTTLVLLFIRERIKELHNTENERTTSCLREARCGLAVQHGRSWVFHYDYFQISCRVNRAAILAKHSKPEPNLRMGHVYSTVRLGPGM